MDDKKSCCVEEKVYKRCPKCNYNHFATEIVVQQKALIGGEGEYLDEYESELTNPVVSDSTVWECTRCGHKAPGADFSVKASELKDEKLADVFSMYVDPVTKGFYVFYKGNEWIGETDKTATLQEIKAEIAKHGYYLVDADDIYSDNIIVKPLTYTAECTVSDGDYSINLKLENLSEPDDFPWVEYVTLMYCATGKFSDGPFTCHFKITSADGIVVSEKTESFANKDDIINY